MTTHKHPTAKLLMNATEAAAYLGISTRQFHRINKLDAFPYIPLGRGRMYQAKALERYLEDRMRVEAGN